MNTKQKSQLIMMIITHLRIEARWQKKQFDDDATFLGLCFMSDDELENVAKLAGV